MKNFVSIKKISSQVNYIFENTDLPSGSKISQEVQDLLRDKEEVKALFLESEAEIGLVRKGIGMVWTVKRPSEKYSIPLEEVPYMGNKSIREYELLGFVWKD